MDLQIPESIRLLSEERIVKQTKKGQEVLIRSFRNYRKGIWTVRFQAWPKQHFGEVVIFQGNRPVMIACGVIAMANAMEMVDHWHAVKYQPEFSTVKCLADYPAGRRADLCISEGRQLGGVKPETIRSAKPKKSPPPARTANSRRVAG